MKIKMSVALPTSLRLFFLLLFLTVLNACSESSPPGDTTTTAQEPSPREAAADAGYTEILVSMNKGFLAQDPVKQKSLLYLNGTHYEMGFQAGYLASAGTATMVHDYLNEFLFEMLDLPFSSGDLGALWDVIRDFLEELTGASMDHVPEEFIEEMQGIVDGYAKAKNEGRTGTERSVEFADVFLLNQGMDVISSLTYNVLGRSTLGCNQFACWGGRTRHGALFHGRDFQFYNAGVYQEQALLAVYVPQGSGSGSASYPFVTVTAPGFVGLATGLNAQGISMGLDVVHAWPARSADPGLGGLLIIRKIMENAATLAGAVEMVREEEKGCPWIYLVADGKTQDAAVLEAIQSNPLDPWMETRYRKNLRVAEQILGEPMEAGFPAQGVSMRSPSYVVDETYRGKAMEIPQYNNSPKYPDDHTFLNYSFPDPIEEFPDLIVATNHYLLPWMRLFQWAPLVSLVWKTYWPSTDWRYETLTGLLLERTDNGFSFDWEAAWETTDFLNPSTPEGAFFHGSRQSQPIGGHVALMDGRNLLLRALYGYYDHPWVEVDLNGFLP